MGAGTGRDAESMQESLAVQFSNGVSYQSLGDGEDAVLLSLNNGYLYRCNHTAIALLDGIKHRLSMAEIASGLAGRYAVSEAQVCHDLEETLNAMLSDGLVERAT